MQANKKPKVKSCECSAEAVGALERDSSHAKTSTKDKDTQWQRHRERQAFSEVVCQLAKRNQLADILKCCLNDFQLDRLRRMIGSGGREVPMRVDGDSDHLLRGSVENSGSVSDQSARVDKCWTARPVHPLPKALQSLFD